MIRGDVPLVPQETVPAPRALHTGRGASDLGWEKTVSAQPLVFCWGFFHPESRCLPINISLRWELPWEAGGWSGCRQRAAVRGLEVSLCVRALGRGNKYTSAKEGGGPEPELSHRTKGTASQRPLFST